MPEWVYSVVAVIVVTGIIMFFVKKRKDDEWEGELFKKRYTPGDMDSSESFKLIFKTTEGKKKRVQVKKRVYEEWNEGDKAKKVKGAFTPEKV